MASGKVPGFSGRHLVRLRNGQALHCLVCGGETFGHRSVKLNTTGASLLGLDWANIRSHGLACVQCGHLQEFAAGYVTLEDVPKHS